jgi:hypothetical protein
MKLSDEHKFLIIIIVFVVMFVMFCVGFFKAVELIQSKSEGQFQQKRMPANNVWDNRTVRR